MRQIQLTQRFENSMIADEDFIMGVVVTNNRPRSVFEKLPRLSDKMNLPDCLLAPGRAGNSSG